MSKQIADWRALAAPGWHVPKVHGTGGANVSADEIEVSIDGSRLIVNRY